MVINHIWTIVPHESSRQDAIGLRHDLRLAVIDSEEGVGQLGRQQARLTVS